MIILITSLYEPYDYYNNLLVSKLDKYHSNYKIEYIENIYFSSGYHCNNEIFIPLTNSPLLLHILSLLKNNGDNCIINKGIINHAKNRLAINLQLQQSNINSPKFWITSNPSNLITELDTVCYPIINKSIFGAKNNTQIILNREDLRFYITNANKNILDDMLYFERYYHSDYFYKMYYCNNKYVIYKKFNDYKQTPVLVSNNMFDPQLAGKISESLDLNFYSADIIINNNIEYVIDVNYYPIYKYHEQAYGWFIDLISRFI